MKSALVGSSLAVSYTHLDVYKRQLQQVCEHDCEAVGQDMFSVLIYTVGLAASSVITEQAEGGYNFLFIREFSYTLNVFYKNTKKHNYIHYLCMGYI